MVWLWLGLWQCQDICQILMRFFSSLFLQAEFVQQLKTCDAIIVMYSLTDRISFHVAREILDDLANLGSVVCPVLLLANKMDLCQHRKVNFKKANFWWFLTKLQKPNTLCCKISGVPQRYTYRVLQTFQMKLIFLCVWAELAVLGSTKTALKFKYEIWIQCMGQDISLKSKRKNPWFKPWFNIFCTHNQVCVPQYKVNV